MNRQVSRKNSSSKLPQKLTSEESPAASSSGCPFSGVLCKAGYSTLILEAVWPQVSSEASPFFTHPNSTAPLLSAFLGPLVFPFHILPLAISLCFPVWNFGNVRCHITAILYMRSLDDLIVLNIFGPQF